MFISFGRAVLLVFILASCLDADERPNFVVFLSDDQGWGDFSFVGNPDVSTPNIDSLASEGVLFENFYVCPVCSPTRAEFLTGRYHPRGNVTGTSAGFERLDLDEKTIADYLQDVGYRTAAFGKWHNGTQAPYHPNSRGFDRFYGFCSGHWGNYFSPMLEENGEIVQGDGFVIDDFTNRAINFIEKNKDERFFVYLPYNTPHSPMQVPDEYWGRFKDKEISAPHRNSNKTDLNHTRAALAMCENIDWNVGRVLKKLDQLNLTNNTIVIYFNDNGPNGHRWNGGLKGTKGSVDEGGVRSPLLIRCPEKISGGKKVSLISGAIDLMPTMLELAKATPVKLENPLDGLSLCDLIFESPKSDKLTNWPTRKLFSHWGGRVSVRTQRFRLDENGQLFDLANDHGQFNPVNDSFQSVANDLKTSVQAWRDSVLAESSKALVPFTVGGIGVPLTQLPARDATATGNIKRSNKYPNCSYFSNWTETEDSIRWPVEVRNQGEYEVEIYYACEDSNVGTELELAGCGGTITARIKDSHFPPMRGAELDRVVRAESYVMDFKPLRMGRITLAKGIGQLKLRALTIPGEQSIEFRLLTLRKMEAENE